ncbi:MAG: copper chaperone PCu(A)C [Rhodospirillales bacterium]|nr:copper chaperone PCu(A)C [Rhodospirillales bacterium]
MKTISLLAAMAVVFLLQGTNPGHADAHSNSVKAGDLTVHSIWARPTAPSAKTGAAYFVIENNGTADDVLTGVTGSISGKTEIHQTTMDGGIMKMRHVGRVDIPAGGSAMLAPGGFHIMFMGLHGPIKVGDQFPLTLTFEKNGSVEITVTGMKAASQKPMDKMDHGKMGSQ